MKSIPSMLLMLTMLWCVNTANAQSPPCSIQSQIEYTTLEGEDCGYVFFPSASTGPFTTEFPYYEWDFGDGNISTEESPEHIYTEPGQYSVCLTVWGVSDEGTCCTSTSCITLNVDCTPPPCSANLTGITTSVPQVPVGSCGTQLNLNISGANRPIAGYFWEFGDGNTGRSNTNSIVHNYPGSGAYQLTVTVVLHSGEEECCTFEYSTFVLVDCPGGGGEIPEDESESSHTEGIVRPGSTSSGQPSAGSHMIEVETAEERFAKNGIKQ